MFTLQVVCSDNLKEPMQIIYTAQEVLDIVLQHTLAEFPRANVNAALFEGYSRPSVIVTHVVPEEEAPVATLESQNA